MGPRPSGASGRVGLTVSLLCPLFCPQDCTICMERLTAPSGYKGPQPTVKPDLVGKLSRCGHVYHVYCLVAMYNNGNKVGASSGRATASQAAPKPGGLIGVAPRGFGGS